MPSRTLDNRTSLVLAVVLVAVAIPAAYFGISRWFSHWWWLSDMHYFYDSAKVVVDGHSDILYDREARFAAGYGTHPNDQVFPYPATIAYLFAPLTLTGVVEVRYWFTGFCVLLFVAIAVIGWRWSRDWRFGALMLLLPASSFTVYEALRFQQLSPVLAFLVCVSAVTAISKRSLAGGALTAVLVLKPSFAIPPLALLTVRRGFRQIAVAVAVGALLFLVVPYLMVGLDGLRDYQALLNTYRAESFSLQGHLTAGAGWMLGWNAIVARLQEGDPSHALVYALDLLTVLVMVRIWLRGRFFESHLAGVLTTLLVVPHVLWYDWTVLIGIAPFAAYANRSLPLVALLLLLHAAVSFDSYLIVTRPIFDAYPVPTPLLASALLLYLALAPLREEAAEEPIEVVEKEKLLVTAT